ncbi:NEDD4-binding protein 2 [Tupaia chinensis]|uniref:NEDD4-binding protein 2 n=1 Tax=Tupaia chinensis TaxID=246437 RepID=L8Y213_TUPCH|nr:NEDD4-binding protein 2 [Tupaia chinensis]
MFSDLDPDVVYLMLSECDFKDVHSFSDPNELINSNSSSLAPILSEQNMDLNREPLENSASTLSSNVSPSHSVLNESKCLTKDNLALGCDYPEESLLSSSSNATNASLVGCGGLGEKHTELLEPERAEAQSSQGPVDLGASEPQAPSNLPGLDSAGTGGDRGSPAAADVSVPPEGFNFKPHKHPELPPKGKDVSYCPVLTPLPFLLPPPPPPPMWNPLIPAFDLFQGNHAFVAPVVTTAPHWRPVTYTFPPSAVSHASPTKGWRSKEGTSAYHIQETPVPHVGRKKTSYVGLVLVLLRGLPGAGKSFLARTLQEDNPSGVVLSTDDYFYINGQYQFDVRYLGEAHEWNQNRAKEAFEKKISPIIIDNTNLQAWEMKPYVALSQKHKYKVLFREPDTWWKFKPKELARRNIHGVSKERIARMLEHYQRFVSVPIIMSSLAPEKAEHAELCTHPGEDRSTSPRNNEDFPSEKEEKVLFSSSKQLELMEEKTLEVAGENVSPECLPNADLSTGRGEAGAGSHGLQSALVQEAVHASPSDSESQAQATDKGEQEEPAETASEKECGEAAAQRSVGTVSPGICCGEDQEDCDPASPVPPPSEKSVPGDMLEERATVKKKAFGKQKSKSTVERFPKHELSNFVGDWPLDRTIGQRTKRTRKTERASSVHSDKRYGQPQASRALDPGDSASVEEGSSPDNAEAGRQAQCHDVPESHRSAKHDTYQDAEKSSLATAGDWPLSESLAQREPRSRWPKTGLHEPSLELGTRDPGEAVSLHTGPEACWGAAPDNLPVLGGSTLGSAAMLPPDMTHESQTCPSEVSSGQLPAPLTSAGGAAADPGGVGSQTAAAFPEAASTGVPGTEAGVCTQTEPQDFALLWKIERNKMSISGSIQVLTGRLDGFKPEAFHINTKSGLQDAIPYRVMHDKSTYVEEAELTSADESENLNILCKLFGSFSLEALKDLYERCNKDIIWATSLLLDSETKLCEDTELESFRKSYDELQMGSFSMGLNLNEMISQRGAVEGFDSSLPEVSPGTGTSDPNGQSACDMEKGIPEQVEVRAATPEKAGFTASIFPDAAGDLRGRDEAGPDSQAELPGPESITPSFPGVLKAATPKDVSEMETLVAAETGDNSFNLSDILNSVSSPSNLELNEEMYFTDSSGIKKTKHLSKDDVQVPNTEEYTKEDEQEMENILMAGGSVSGGVGEEDKTETPNPTPATMAKSLTIDCLELALPPELAFQLSELFGPVGIDSGSLTVEDCVVHIDLNLAKVIHEKWKESVMERQRQEEVSCGKRMRDPSSLIGQIGLNDSEQKSPQRTGKKLLKTLAAPEMLPLLDHWNTQTKKVSLREIMSEEIALQEKFDLKRETLMFEKDCATKLKEKQLFKIFPAINENFLADIFKDHNYSLEHTVQFLNCVLEGDPVKTVVAQECIHQNENVTAHTAQKSKERKAKKSKETEDTTSEPFFQDFEYPEYDDYRAEAFLHQQKRMECYSKAKEAYRMGKKNVATFYAQQKMKEANHLAAVEIFEKVNASLLPQSVLDLHGLHVDEAIEHLITVLQQKTEEFKQNGGKPYLSVITGRGNHSQGGVARIKPAVIKYLTSHSFRSEEEQGCVGALSLGSLSESQHSTLTEGSFSRGREIWEPAETSTSTVVNKNRGCRASWPCVRS